MHGINCKDRYKNVVETWGKDIDYIFYSDYEDEKKKIIKTSNNISYYGLEEKILNASKKINEIYCDYDWFFFCDDDTFVNTKLLISKLETFDENYVHGQILVHGWRIDPSLIFCSGGAGTLMHKKLLQKLSSNIKNNNIGIADVSLCMNMRDNKIEIKNSNLFYNNTPQSKNIKESDYKNYITFHNIKTEEMMKHLYNVVNSN